MTMSFDNSDQHLLVDKVSIAYGQHIIVQDVSLAVAVGEIGCLLGPSGCGKSTLLRAIAGFVPLKSGCISLAGKILAKDGLCLPAESRNVGMVFQDVALFPHINIAENVAFGLHHWPKPQQVKRVEELLDLVGLNGYQERYPHALSGGQQQRVALARAIAPKPSLLLLDEPFSGLDAMLREELVPEVSAILRHEKIPGLLVTHDQTEAFTMADHVAVMNQGRIEQWDTAYNIYHKPDGRFVADFIGEGDFLACNVSSKTCVESIIGHLCSDRIHGFAVGDKAEVFIRPDDVLHLDGSPITGRIINKRFRGTHFLYRVLVAENQTLYCFADSHHNHEIGEEIGIKLSLDHLMLF
ncbi:MAG: iron(III) transport system ATP-binding protein [Gammaproteobacteria bacterium]|jgi:iron(III) transport system ATP-binding protein